jgi:acylphosphatase
VIRCTRQPGSTAVNVNRGFLVSGRVQGVGFRYAARQRAVELGLTGWVRNLANGDVDAEVHGATDAVTAFETWLWQGPRHARVHSVTARETEPSEFTEFRILTSRPL